LAAILLEVLFSAKHQLSRLATGIPDMPSQQLFDAVTLIHVLQGTAKDGS
jgi:recombinational DNA repair protein RecR